MSTTADEIGRVRGEMRNLVAVIDKYEDEYFRSTDAKDKSELRTLITARSTDLTALRNELRDLESRLNPAPVAGIYFSYYSLCTNFCFY